MPQQDASQARRDGLRGAPRRRGATTARALASITALTLVAGATPSAEAATLGGVVKSGDQEVTRAPVALLKMRGTRAPVAIGEDRSDRRGRFSIRYRRPNGPALLYAVSGAPGTSRWRAVRLATMLGASPRAARIRINERTTIAAAFAEAQFVSRWRIAGSSPGPQNAALMARNLADPRTGRPSEVLRTRPNGFATPTRKAFNSLANMLAGCARDEHECRRLLRATRIPGERRTASTLDAFAGVARNPGTHARRLFRLSRSGPAPYRPALSRSERPNNWALFLRFFGDGSSLDGPGNIAFDAEGNAWVANNYEYNRIPGQPVCGGKIVAVFRPDGSYASFSPIRGGGVSGSGYGITFDPEGDVWVGNFGFASPAPGCPAHRQPPHNTLSKFAVDGLPLSGPRGIDAGSLSWPQGTVSNSRGDIWVANCGPYGDPLSDTAPHDSFTIYPAGDPAQAKSVRDPNLDKPFDVAFNRDDIAFVSSTQSDKVGMYEPSGSPTARSPLSGGGINHPMGLAADTRGNIWVANSGVVNLPCPGTTLDLSERGGSVSLIGHDGRVLSPGGTAENPGGGFTGGGALVPWGIAVDGDDNVWVSNFAGERVSAFCGTRPRNCPKGLRTGKPISPKGGYGFSGLQRNTAVEVDPSGNLWITNNWKRIPVIKNNPGGYHVVIMVGAAAPTETPLIGQPKPLP